jgi:excisionase family DNA binding protein
LCRFAEISLTRPAPRAAPRGDQWLSLGAASRLLGVSQATIRRWSDAGRLKAFTTPGGHRRFSRAALERMLPSSRDRRPAVVAAALTPARLSRAYRRDARAVAAVVPFVATLNSDDRERFRMLGRRIAASLAAHLDEPDEEARTHQLSEAAAAAADYGRQGAALGGSLSDVVEGFLAFRRPFLSELGSVARRRGFDADEVTSLFADAERALDRLLVATMTGHSVASLPRARVERRNQRPVRSIEHR